MSTLVGPARLIQYPHYNLVHSSHNYERLYGQMGDDHNPQIAGADEGPKLVVLNTALCKGHEVFIMLR